MSFQSTKVLFLSRCKYKFESHVVNHCHNFHHLLYVTGGCGTLTVSGAAYAMRENEMYVVPPGTYHSFVSDLSRPLCTIEVKALVGDPRLAAYLKHMPLCMTLPHAKLKLILEAMLDEATYCRPQYKEMITANFIEFILNIQRLHSMSEQPDEREAAAAPDLLREAQPSASLLPAKAEPGDDVAGRAIQYLHANYDRKIVLKEMARRLAVSSAHLCRAFYERYRVSPMQYLNNWRMHEAKELLKNTDLSITEISAKVGFQSVHYLSRRFAARENVSPLQYRQQMKEIVELKIEEKYDVVDHHIVMQRQ